MTDTEIIEQYFKARGRTDTAKHYQSGEMVTVFIGDDGNGYYDFPQILTDFPAFKEHVLEVMGEEGLRMEAYKAPLSTKYLMRWVGGGCQVYDEIKDNNILHAAVQSATRYWEGKE